VPFYFINLLPTSLLYISILLTAHTGARHADAHGFLDKIVTLLRCRIQQQIQEKPFNAHRHAPLLHSLCQGFGNAGACCGQCRWSTNFGRLLVVYYRIAHISRLIWPAPVLSMVVALIRPVVKVSDITTSNRKFSKIFYSRDSGVRNDSTSSSIELVPNQHGVQHSGLALVFRTISFESRCLRPKNRACPFCIAKTRHKKIEIGTSPNGVTSPLTWTNSENPDKTGQKVGAASTHPLTF
jgi:hypothetical protein